MIEITTTYDTEQGSTIIADAKLLEPDRKLLGFGLHLIPRYGYNTVVFPTESWLNKLGLVKVYHDISTNNDIYTTRKSYHQVIAIQFLIRANWKIIRWLYWNARMFQPIPTGEMFSWRYLTAYVLLRRLYKMVRRLI